MLLCSKHIASVGTDVHLSPEVRHRPVAVPLDGVCFPVMLTVEPEDATWAWFAGLFEGEGSIVLHRTSRWRCRFQVKTTDDEVARLLQERVGGRVFGPYSYRSRDGHPRKPFSIWVSDGLTPTHVSAHIWPWLGERRRAKLRSFGLEPGVAERG